MTNIREIEVWVHPTFVEAFENGDITDIPTFKQPFGRHFAVMVKAKLIVNIAIDKRVTIRESDFNEAYAKSVHNGHNSHIEVFERMKQKLFSKEGL